MDYLDYGVESIHHLISLYLSPCNVGKIKPLGTQLLKNNLQNIAETGMVESYNYFLVIFWLFGAL